MTTHTQILRAHLDTADHNWFAAHPSAQWRWRRYVPGEDESTAQLCPVVTHTAVFHRPDGLLVRRYYRTVEG